METGQITETAAFGQAARLQAAGRHAEAIAIYKRLLAGGARDRRLLHNLGWACFRTFDPDAETYLREALALAPDKAPAQRALAYAIKSAGRFAESEALLRQAAPSLSPDDTGHEALAHAVLGQGRWAEGFRLLDARVHRRTSEGWKLGIPEWRGEALAGKRLLVLAEQGLGDQIQMARYLPELQAAHVTYVGPPALAGLFAGLVTDYRRVGPGEPFTVSRHDYWTLPLSLPLHLGATEISGEPYLPSAGGGTGVGLAWRGNPANWVDAARSLPESLARELLARPDVISLQPEDTGARDLADTAEIIKGLAHVIAVDSAVAHLAGAMGKPTALLLPALGLDWRWLADRSDTPWYGSMRLFRQHTPGDWRGVVDRVLAARSGEGPG